MIRLLLLMSTTAALTACATCRIEPPIGIDEREKKLAADIAAELKEVQVSGKLKTEYQNLTRRTFATLSNANTALLLLIQAYDCARKHDDREAASAFREAIREQYRETVGIVSAVPPSSDRLAPEEVARINRSDFAPEIIHTLSAPEM